MFLFSHKTPHILCRHQHTHTPAHTQVHTHYFAFVHCFFFSPALCRSLPPRLLFSWTVSCNGIENGITKGMLPSIACTLVRGCVGVGGSFKIMLSRPPLSDCNVFCGCKSSLPYRLERTALFQSYLESGDFYWNKMLFQIAWLVFG